jgi:predicted HAD superfamily phosphohydrolase
MRTYEVRVLVPKLELIDAEDEADLFEKVGELYKKLYRREARELVEILPEPEDFA